MTIQERLARAKAGDVVKPTSVPSSSAPKNNLSVTERLNIAKQAELPTAPVVPKQAQPSTLERIWLAGKSGASGGIAGTVGALQTAGQWLGSKASDLFGTEKALQDPEKLALLEKMAQSGAFGQQSKGEAVLNPDKLHQQSGQDLARATEGASGVGKFALEGLSSVANMGTGALTSLATGVPFTVAMGTQAGGSAALSAKEQGKTIDQQLLYGGATGLTVGAIEALGGIGASKALSPVKAKVFSSVLSKLPAGIGKWATSTGGQIFSRILSSGLSEAAEEGIEYNTDRWLQKLILDEEVPFDIKEMAYQSLLGGTVGGLFGVANVGADALRNRIGNAKQTQTIGAETQADPNVPATPPQSTQNDAIAQTDIPMPQEQLSQQRATESVREPSVIDESIQNVQHQPTMTQQATKPLPEGLGAMSKSVAQVLTEAPVKKTPFKAFVDNVVDYTSRKITDSGKTIDTIGKRTGDATLYHAYNNAKQGAASAEYMIGEAQTDANGNKVGEGLMDIIFPIKENGKQYYQNFSDYLMHKHNIDRMSLEQRTNGEMPNKPVFGEAVSAYTSQNAVANFEQQYPEFVDLAQKIYNYNQNLMQFRIDTGLISQEQADRMNELYPHYVPTYRDMAGTSGSTSRGNTVQILTGIKGATGSERNILPIDLSMARQTMQTVQAGRRNQFGNRLLQNAEQNVDTLGDHIITLEELQESLLDMDTESDIGLGLDNTFIIYRDGKPVQMKVSKGVYDGLKAISSTGNENNPVLAATIELNNTFKKLVTGWNPIFTPKNFLRDIQDAGLFSKDFKAFAENYPLAVKEITTNGPYWQQYKALGGIASSYFDYDKGIKNKSSWVKRNTLDRVEQLNIAVEQAPRLAEFMATVKKGNGSYENLMEGMYNSADVTVNFGRSGTLTKQLNRTFAPFLNPSVQGASKLARRFTETKGVKQWAGLIVRAAALAVVPAVLNQMLYKDDEEYEKISDREKDTNYLFKLGDGYWLKIPKGRALSLFGSFAQRTDRAIRGEENAYAGFINTAIDQSAPNNPFTDNIVAPISAVATNTTWYGTPIEGQRLQNYAPSERYDESTDTFSKWLGKALGYSPKKINYLLDSYTGVIGDFALPIMTPKAEQNPFVKAFSIDATSSNKISQQFYDKADEIKYSKNETDAEPSLAIVTRFYNRQSGAVSDLYSEIRDIENSKLSDKEKKVKVRELKATLNAIQQNALNVVDKYAEVAKKNYTGEKPAEIAAATLQTDWDVFGAEYAIKTNLSEAKQEQAETAKKAGVPYDTFLDVVSQYQKLKPESGKKNVSLEQKLGALTSTKHSEKDKAVLTETLYDNSLLHKLDSHSTLLNIYKSTKDTSYINMTVPDKFSENKTEYVLTDSEKALYEKTFVEFMNKQGKPAPIGSMQAEQARMKKLIGLAKDRARLEVVRNRR